MPTRPNIFAVWAHLGPPPLRQGGASYEEHFRHERLASAALIGSEAVTNMTRIIELEVEELQLGVARTTHQEEYVAEPKTEKAMKVWRLRLLASAGMRHNGYSSFFDDAAERGEQMAKRLRQGCATTSSGATETDAERYLENWDRPMDELETKHYADLFEQELIEMDREQLLPPAND